MTLALPKEGLRAAAAQDLVGELYVADISVPPALYSQLGLGSGVSTIFSVSEVLRLR